MNRNGPVVVIEDDEDDQEILKEIFQQLNYTNEVVFFRDGEKALEYLNSEDTYPFLILSDVNMPKMNGFELRNTIQTSEQLHIKCIPYLFFSTSANKQAVVDAYSMSVQGFFIKAHSIEKLKGSIRKIMEYWGECIAPNEYE